MTTYTSPFSGNTIQPTDVSYASYTGLTSNLVLQWPVNGNTGNPAARVMEISFTGSGGLVYMPDATQVSVGQDALIRNVGSTQFTVVGYGGTTIIALAAGQAEYIYVTNNSTQNGTWGMLTFGSGNYAGAASALAGYGLEALSATLNQAYTISALSAAYTFLASDQATAFVWSGGTTTATLTAAGTLGSSWFVLVKNNGTGTLTVNCSGSDTIDGATSKTFQPGNSAFIICTGTGFITVGYGTSSTFVYSVLTLTVTGGSYTLTASQASNTIQEYSGTLTSNVTVTFPPVANLYVISNQTNASGYSFTVTTGVSGGATATVPASGQATLICDGKNFYNANTTQAGSISFALVNGNAGSPSLYFASETSTGIYRKGTGDFSITVLGTDVADFTSSGLNVLGSGNFTGGISGGTF